jgi:hypothetical protein
MLAKKRSARLIQEHLVEDHGFAAQGGASAEARAAAAAGMMLHQDGSRQQDTAHDDGYKSIPKKRKRRKTPGPSGVNTCLCDDDANSPTRDSGERGEKHRSR